MTESIPLHDGTSIPQLGFGTYLVPSEEASRIVSQAIHVGYRHIDTAQLYYNEREAGEGIRASEVPREEIYITTKLSIANHRRDDVLRSYDESAAKLGVEKLDLFLMHWPLPTQNDGGFISTWCAMTELVQEGRVTSVGVSNFEPAHLRRIIDETGIVPVVNQIEAHPFLRNDVAREATRTAGIAVEAWSPLGQGSVLENSEVAPIAQMAGKTPAQVVLRWHIQRGDIIFPKSIRLERMRENFDLFDFVLESGDMAAIDALNRGESGRVGPNPNTYNLI